VLRGTGEGVSRWLAFSLLGAILGFSGRSLYGQTLPGGRDFSLPRAEVSLTYSPTEANAGPGQCGCFFMNGASAEGNFRTYRAYTTVVDVTAAHTGQINNTGQPFSLLMATGGVRLNFRLGHQRVDGFDTYHNLKPFVQGLVGFAHGFDSAFPSKSGFIQPTANSVAFLGGIGLDYKYHKHLSFRVIQADYGYTRLPNLAANDQNLLRISSGITIHLK
jgi:outer membrane immunogenic protein